MNSRTVTMLFTTAFIAACGQGETPDTAIELPVRYAAVDLADITTAEALTGRRLDL